MLVAATTNYYNDLYYCSCYCSCYRYRYRCRYRYSCRYCYRYCCYYYYYHHRCDYDYHSDNDQHHHDATRPDDNDQHHDTTQRGTATTACILLRVAALEMPNCGNPRKWWTKSNYLPGEQPDIVILSSNNSQKELLLEVSFLLPFLPFVQDLFIYTYRHLLA